MMSDEGYFHISARFWRMLLGLVLSTGFVIGFWEEIKLSWKLTLTFIYFLFLRPVVLPLTFETFRAILLLGLSVITFIFGYLILLAWTSRFVLPADTPSDKREVAKRLRSFSLPFGSSHGPAVFIREGRTTASKDELSETGQGVALLDLFSAVVLEQQEGDDDSRDHARNTKSMRFLLKSMMKKLAELLESSNEKNDEPMVRALGPGLVLVADGEKIAGSIDLRQQFRRRQGVSCNTGDGIEITTTISITFTVGEKPDILKIAEINGDWKIIKIEVVPLESTETDSMQNTSRHIKISKDELSEEEKSEINKYFLENNFTWSIGEMNKLKEKNTDNPPYSFDEDRVIGAISSRARDVKKRKLGEWTDLPVDVAVEIFRNKLIHTSYDELYKPNDPGDFPLKKFKAEFVTDVKRSGILGFHIVRRKDGRPLENNQQCRISDLVFSPDQEFTYSADLRERGIKVKAVGFSDLEPTDKIVRERFFDTWRAHWQQETEKTLAEHELQATRIRNRERARAQQDMIYSLSQILQSDQYTNEALVMRLYQALEAAATQPVTQRLLPRDTIRMLWNLRQWLLPGEETKGNTYPLGEFVDGEETDQDE